MFGDLWVRGNELDLSRDIGVLLVLEVAYSLPEPKRDWLKNTIIRNHSHPVPELYPAVNPPVPDVTASAEDPSHFN